MDTITCSNATNTTIDTNSSTTTNDISIALGQTFNSWKEFHDYMESYSLAIGQPLYNHPSESTKRQNTLLSANALKYPEGKGFEYICHEFICPLNGTGKRKGSMSKYGATNDCPVKICGAYNRLKKVIVVRTVMLGHNHSLDLFKDYFRLLYARNLPNEKQDFLCADMKGCSVSSIIDYAAEHYGIQITASDVANMKQRYRKRRRKEQLENSMKESSDPTQEENKKDVATNLNQDLSTKQKENERFPNTSELCGDSDSSSGTDIGCGKNDLVITSPYNYKQKGFIKDGKFGESETENGSGTSGSTYPLLSCSQSEKVFNFNSIQDQSIGEVIISPHYTNANNLNANNMNSITVDRSKSSTAVINDGNSAHKNIQNTGLKRKRVEHFNDDKLNHCQSKRIKLGTGLPSNTDRAEESVMIDVDMLDKEVNDLFLNNGNTTMMKEDSKQDESEKDDDVILIEDEMDSDECLANKDNVTEEIKTKTKVKRKRKKIRNENNPENETDNIDKVSNDENRQVKKKKKKRKKEIINVEEEKQMKRNCFKDIDRHVQMHKDVIVVDEQEIERNNKKKKAKVSNYVEENLTNEILSTNKGTLNIEIRKKPKNINLCSEETDLNEESYVRKERRKKKKNNVIKSGEINIDEEALVIHEEESLVNKRKKKKKNHHDVVIILSDDDINRKENLALSKSKRKATDIKRKKKGKKTNVISGEIDLELKDNLVTVTKHAETKIKRKKKNKNMERFGISDEKDEIETLVVTNEEKEIKSNRKKKKKRECVVISDDEI